MATVADRGKEQHGRVGWQLTTLRRSGCPEVSCWRHPGPGRLSGSDGARDSTFVVILSGLRRGWSGPLEALQYSGAWLDQVPLQEAESRSDSFCSGTERQWRTVNWCPHTRGWQLIINLPVDPTLANSNCSPPVVLTRQDLAIPCQERNNY